MTTKTNPCKGMKKISLANQVKNILFSFGYSFAFNENDFIFFRSKVGRNPHEIANSFISECLQPSDFNDYIF